MDFLDIRTVFFFFIIHNLLVAGVSFLLWRSNRYRFSGLDLWTAGYFLFGIGIFLVLTQGSFPVFVSVILANIVIVMGVASLCRGFVLFSGGTYGIGADIAAVLLFVLFNLYYSLVSPSVSMRIVGISLAIVYLTFRAVYRLFFRKTRLEGLPYYPIGIVIAGLGLLNFFRFINAALFPGTGNLLSSKGFDPLVLSLAQVFLSYTAYRLFLTVNMVLNKDLAEQSEMKEVLIRETNHRVKNNLMMVSSLLRLQAASGTNAEVWKGLKEAEERVSSIAAVQEAFQSTKDMRTVVVADFILPLVRTLTGGKEMAGKGIRIDFDLAETALSIDQAVPLGLLINELVTNALKHAFTSGKGGRIKVRFQETPDGFCFLEVLDDGVGFPPDFHPDRAESLGLQIVYSLARQVGGYPEFRNGTGVDCVVKFQKKP